MFITQLLKLIYRQMLSSTAAGGKAGLACQRENIVREEVLYFHVPMTTNHNVPKE
jgi:hypothetical protein